MWSNSSKPCSRGAVLQRIWFSLGSYLSVLSLSFLIVFKFWLLIDFKTQLNGERETIRAINKTLKHHILFFWVIRELSTADNSVANLQCDCYQALMWMQVFNCSILYNIILMDDFYLVGVRCLCWKHVHIKLVKAIFLAVIVPDQKKLV